MTDDLCCEFSHKTITSWKRICACLLTYLLTYLLTAISEWSHLQDRHWTRHVKYWSGNMLGISFSISPENFSFRTYIDKRSINNELKSPDKPASIEIFIIVIIIIINLPQQRPVFLATVVFLAAWRSNGRGGVVSGCLAQQRLVWCCF